MLKLTLNTGKSFDVTSVNQTYNNHITADAGLWLLCIRVNNPELTAEQYLECMTEVDALDKIVISNEDAVVNTFVGFTKLTYLDVACLDEGLVANMTLEKADEQ